MSPIHGMMYYEINMGKTNSERFSVFLKNLFKKDIFKLQSMLCIMDNARLHKTKKVIHIHHMYTRSIHHPRNYICIAFIYLYW